MKILHLTLKKKWFDMIASGEKKEEYREIKKYWAKRLCSSAIYHGAGNGLLPGEPACHWNSFYPTHFVDFDKVVFRNGYSKNAPKIEFECLTIEIGEGWENLGAEPGKKYFVIKLGEQL